ncbi:MAG: rRNA maturation RNase YbeY [Betaproteobacteria bacterium]|nr:rRNA maturation RNase YbeY [Betaproteobacteria bacterium]
MPTIKTPPQPRRRNRVAVQRAVSAALSLPSARLLRRYALTAATAGCNITLRVVGAAESKRLNSRYRRKERATNVLSFQYQSRPLAGDVVLCHAVIAKEAKAQGKTLAAHYAHLVVHGVLHLRGHQHQRKNDAARMEKTEIRLLRRLGFADPYAEKAAAIGTLK